MEYIRTFTKEFDVGDRLDLNVDTRSGSLTVRGEDTTTAHVEVVARLWAEDADEADAQTELIERGITCDGKRLAIKAPTLLRQGPFLLFGRGPRIDYQVTVPRATEATIANHSGRVEIERIKGPLDLESRSGRVSVRQIDDDAKIVSRSGSVQVESIAGGLSVESRSGTVRIRDCKQDANVVVRSGTLQVEDVGGSLKVDSRSGVVGISEVGGGLTVRTASGMVRYDGPVGGPFDIDVTSGSVRLAVDADSRFFLDAESAHGSVQSDLPMRRDSQRGASEQGGPTVRIRTRSGSIHIGTR
jgi:DUF4097 and DUF4098 domain-containing protein YvlB